MAASMRIVENNLVNNSFSGILKGVPKMARIKIIDYNEGEDRLNEIYGRIIKNRGKLASIHKIQSLRPESITYHMDLYMEIMYSRSELSRAEREMIGTVVSATNGCGYCTIHHSEALNHYWKDRSRISNLINRVNEDILTRRERTLSDFARHLTLNPSEHEGKDFTGQLRSIGLSDAGILDVVMVTAYFNFVNRIVLSLGVDIEDDGGTGYRY